MSDWRNDDDQAFMEARRRDAELRARAQRVAAEAVASRSASIMSARTIGLLSRVDVGWSIWARTDGDVRQIRLDSTGEARGGVVVEVTSRRYADPDTGEIVLERAFRCIDPYRTRPYIRFTTLLEGQVNPDGIEVPERTRRWKVICALLREAQREGQPLDLLRTEEDRASRIADAWRLVRVGR
jgi:hypothetical protein